MGNRLKGKVAVVTGAGRGIGRAESLALAAEGAKLVVNDLGAASDGSGASQTPAAEVCGEIINMGGEAVPNYNSVATPEGGDNIIKTAIDAFGRIDILVNNAGILRDRMLFNMTEEEWDLVIKIHLYGTFHCTRAASVYMRQQRAGRIINTSSISGLGNLGQANYSAAKEGIIGFTRTVSLDLGRYGVTCNAIRPNAATRLTMTPELKAKVAKGIAAQGITKPEDVDKFFNQMFTSKPEHIPPIVVYLATDEAAYINGRSFFINGNNIGFYTEPQITSQINKDKDFWTLDELLKVVPEQLCKGVVNPAPAEPKK
ncbi:MAG: SDR family NAD(P)-dependent oxidoreductase [Dehalococcoidia bacterium]|jgi:NAD(P)-dependent dehydrogenase (short-subunit alcohol dehydrogenase family)